MKESKIEFRVHRHCVPLSTCVYAYIVYTRIICSRYICMQVLSELWLMGRYINSFISAADSPGPRTLAVPTSLSVALSHSFSL